MERARLAVFAPLDSTARVEAVVRRLTDAIALGLLADGEQLPSEAELAGQLGVSTVTLREALMALRQQGMVETRRGRGGGSFVRLPSDLDPAHPGRAVLRGYAVDELRDLGDHYAAIAGAAARLAAQRALPSDLAPLLRSLDEMSDAEWDGRLRRLDGRFHVEVAAASQSARLTQEEIRLQADIGGLLWLSWGEHHEMTEKQLFDQHRAIVEAIRAGSGDQARELAERHVLDAVDHLIELRLRLQE